MKKTDLKRKSAVKLRQRLLANGNYSLFLDIFWEGERSYEFLNLYLTNTLNKADKRQNEDSLKLAEQIKAQRLIDLQNGKYKINQGKGQESFIFYFERLTKDRLNSLGNYGNWDSTLKHIKKFSEGKDVCFNDVDESWLIQFKQYLLREDNSLGKKKLSQNSCHSYYNKVKAALRQASEEKYINDNPASRIRGIKQAESKREFLTWEEIQKISQEKCNTKNLKEAFMFSILTGLRWSDIIKMTWSEVLGSDTGGWNLRFQQQKTKDFEVLPISQQARDLLGKHRDPDEKVFRGLKYSAYTTVALCQWMMSAGIHRHITFHCARHTHATLLLSKGVDIYTVSKLLGHKHIKTTEIYAKVTNIKKNEAIAMVPQLDMNLPPI